MEPHLLSRRSGRTFYNVADALRPVGEDGSPGAGDFDLVPEVERKLRGQGVGAVRRLWLVLALIEWLPLLVPGHRRGFSHLPVESRQRWLEGWRNSRLGCRRKAYVSLKALVAESFSAHTDVGA